MNKYPTTEDSGRISNALKDQFGHVSRYLEWAEDNPFSTDQKAYWSARTVYTMLALRELELFYGQKK